MQRQIYANTYKYIQIHTQVHYKYIHTYKHTNTLCTYLPHRSSVPRTGIATLELESQPGWPSGISRKRRTNVPSRSWPGKDAGHFASHHSLRRYSNQPQPCIYMYAEARLRGGGGGGLSDVMGERAAETIGEIVRLTDCSAGACGPAVLGGCYLERNPAETTARHPEWPSIFPSLPFPSSPTLSHPKQVSCSAATRLSFGNSNTLV